MKKKLSEDVRDQIEELIAFGKLPPGEHLDETELAERFGVSRTPIREALNQLATAGLVELRARRGALCALIIACIQLAQPLSWYWPGPAPKGPTNCRILLANVLHDAGRTTAGRLIPYTLFTDPELGRVGLTEEQALAQGYAAADIAVATLPAAKIPRANTAGETAGLLKAVVARRTHRILGGSLFCHSAGEVMSVVQMAMIGKVPYTGVRDTVFTHPTMAESLNLLFAGL